MIAQELDHRMAELFKKFSAKAKYIDTYKVNCHGAAAYILGLTPSPLWIDGMGMKVLVEHFHFRDVSPRSISRGDLVVIGNYNHTGVVTSSDGPLIFSKHGEYHCHQQSLKTLRPLYDGKLTFRRAD